MGLPLITLQPGGSRPPTSPQKVNILAVLGASAIGHGHSIEEIGGLGGGARSPLGGPSDPVQGTTAGDAGRLYINTTTYDVFVARGAEQWIKLTRPAYTESADPPVDHSVPWFDTTTGAMSVWYVDAWVEFSGPGAAGADYAATVTDSTLGNGLTLTSLPLVDETVYHHPGATLDTFTFRLPSSANSRAGQIKTFFSGSIIWEFTLDLNGGSLAGNAMSDTLANEAYSWQCSTPGTWLRLS